MDAKKEKVNSPDQLNEYIKLTNSGVWLVLIAIIFMIIGACAWAWFGVMDTKIDTMIVSSSDGTFVLVKESDFDKVSVGMPVEINNVNMVYKIIDIDPNPIRVTAAMDDYARHKAGLEVGNWVYKCKIDINLEYGSYNGDVIIESVAPSVFITN